MGKPGWGVVSTFLVTFLTASPLAASESGPVDFQEADPAMPRIRTADPEIKRAIAQAVDWSPTFRRLVEAIERTDGLVWIRQGQCRGTFACLLTYLEISGPNRLLLIHVDPRRRGDRLMISLGHELQHAVEVLGSSARSSVGVYNFFALDPRTYQVGGRFETNEAVKAELDVSNEIARARRSQSETPLAGQP